MITSFNEKLNQIVVTDQEHMDKIDQALYMMGYEYKISYEPSDWCEVDKYYNDAININTIELHNTLFNATVIYPYYYIGHLIEEIKDKELCKTYAYTANYSNEHSRYMHMAATTYYGHTQISKRFATALAKIGIYPFTDGPYGLFVDVLTGEIVAKLEITAFDDLLEHGHDVVHMLESIIRLALSDKLTRHYECKLDKHDIGNLIMEMCK